MATAALSLRTLLAKDTTRLGRARSSHGSRSPRDRLRNMAWKAPTIFAGLDQKRHAGVDSGHCDPFRLGQPVATEGEGTRDDRRRWHPGQRVVGSVCLVATCRSFRYNVKAAPESLLLQLPPKRSSVTLARSLSRIKPRQLELERAFARAEDVGPPTTQDLAHKVSAKPCPAYDLLYDHSIPGGAENGCVLFLLARIALVLDPPGGSEQARIDNGHADRAANPMHPFAYRIQRARLAFSIKCQRSATWVASGSTLAAARAYPAPRSRAINHPICGRAASRAWAVAGSQSGKSAIVLRLSRSPHRPDQRVVAHRQHQPAGEVRRRPVTERKTEVMDNLLKPLGAPRPRRRHVRLEALSEDPTTAHLVLTEEPES